MNIDYDLLDNSVIVYVDGKPFHVSGGDHRFKPVCDAIHANKLDLLPDLLDINKSLNLQSGLAVKDGMMFFKDDIVPSAVADKFIDFKMNNVPLKPLLNCWLNIQYNEKFKNINKDKVFEILSRPDSYSLTSDGFFIIYKDGDRHSSSNKERVNREELKDTPFFDYSSLDPFYREMFDKKMGLEEIVSEVYGVCSPKLLKLIVEKLFDKTNQILKISCLSHGYAYRDLLSLNGMMSMFEEDLMDSHYVDPYWYKKANTFLKNFTEKKVLNFFRKEKEQKTRYFAQVVDLYDYLKEKVNLDVTKFLTFREVYEFLKREEKKLKYAEVQFNNLGEAYSKLMEKPFELSINTKENPEVLELVFPHNNYQLIDWGQELNNCIGSYGESVKRGQTMVAAVMNKDGKLLYTLEVAQGRIRQFVQNRNHYITNQAHFEAVCQKLKELNLISAFNYSIR